MTDAELEELERLLADCMPGDWRVCPYRLAVVLDDEKGEMQVADIRGWGHLTGGGVGAHGMSDIAAERIQKAHAEVIARSKRAIPTLLSTIRTLKAEVEKRDRVVEAARLKLAAEDKVNGNIAFGEHDEDAARANWRAWTNLAAALSALDQEDTP